MFFGQLQFENFMMARRWARALLLVVIASLIVLAPRAKSADLKSETVAEFDRYIRLTEAHMAESVQAGNFLVVDVLPGDRRQQTYDQLQQGQLYIQQLQTLQEGKPVKIPSGLIHHWVGVAFLRGVSIAQALAVLEDYNNEDKFFKPTVMQSRLESRDGDESKIFLRFYQKSIVTVVFNANFDVRRSRVDDSRLITTSYSTKIAEVSNPGKPDEHEYPVGKDHGYLWRMYSYWHVEEKDGGVYIQVESIGLSRPIPRLVAWIVNPIVSQVPRQYLTLLLNKTREVAQQQVEASARK
jgi:hypothetical protein